MLKQMQTLFFILLASMLLLLSACSTPPSKKAGTVSIPTPMVTSKQLPHQNAINEIYQLNTDQNADKAQGKIYQLKLQKLNRDELLLITAAEAQSYNILGEHQKAWALLSNPQIDVQLPSADDETQTMVGLTKANTLTALEEYNKAAQLRVYFAPTIKNIEAYQQNQAAIWHNINALTETELKSQIIKTHNPSYKQWLTLNQITRFNTQSLNQQIKNIDQWQHRNATHPAALIPPQDVAALRMAATQRPTKIAVILPFDSKYKKLAAAISDGISHAYYLSDYQPIISFYSADKSQVFADIYHTAVSEGAELIIGPLFKNQLEELYNMNELPVNTISLNRLDRTDKPKNLIEFSLSSEDEIDTVIQFLKHQGKRNVLLLTQDAPWAIDDAEYFKQQWQENNLQLLNSQSFAASKDQSNAIQQLLNIDKSKQRIRRLSNLLAIELEAEPRIRKDADLVYLLAKPNLAASIRPMLKFHYAGDLPVYANSSVYRSYPNPTRDRDLSGIYFTDLPWVISPHKDMDKTYAKSSLKRMVAFGFDAFQLSERLALMQNLPESKLNGATGTLQLENNQLHRTTAMGQFKGRKIIAINTAQ
ncbi:MAG: penicillin-binding protein activator [Pseudomonadales bacterium]|nr:penicillin-binding protein activator [Pseudomonadales bacterium]